MKCRVWTSGGRTVSTSLWMIEINIWSNKKFKLLCLVDSTMLQRLLDNTFYLSHLYQFVFCFSAPAGAEGVPSSGAAVTHCNKRQGLFKDCHADNTMSDYLPCSWLMYQVQFSRRSWSCSLFLLQSSFVVVFVVIVKFTSHSVVCFVIFSLSDYLLLLTSYFGRFAITCIVQALDIIHGFPGSVRQRSHLYFVSIGPFCKSTLLSKKMSSWPTFLGFTPRRTILNNDNIISKPVYFFFNSVPFEMNTDCTNGKYAKLPQFITNILFWCCR